MGNRVKKNNTDQVYYELLFQKPPIVNEYPIHIVYEWHTRDLRKDIDNVAFSKKFINDGMVKYQLIKNDSRKFVASIEDRFFVSKSKPRVVVTVYKADSFPQNEVDSMS